MRWTVFCFAAFNIIILCLSHSIHAQVPHLSVRLHERWEEAANAEGYIHRGITMSDSFSSWSMEKDKNESDFLSKNSDDVGDKALTRHDVERGIEGENSSALHLFQAGGDGATNGQSHYKQSEENQGAGKDMLERRQAETAAAAANDYAAAEEAEGEDKSESKLDPFETIDKLDPAIVTHLHNLTTYESGQSKVERLAKKIEKRNRERIPVTFRARVMFLKTCRNIAIEKGYEPKTQIHLLDLLEYRDKVKDQLDGRRFTPSSDQNRIQSYFRVINDKHCLLEVLERGIETVQNSQIGDDDWFYYQ